MFVALPSLDSHLKHYDDSTSYEKEYFEKKQAFKEKIRREREEFENRLGYLSKTHVKSKLEIAT